MTYVLVGLDKEHSLCANPFYEQCPRRIACARCPFYGPKPWTLDAHVGFDLVDGTGDAFIPSGGLGERIEFGEPGQINRPENRVHRAPHDRATATFTQSADTGHCRWVGLWRRVVLVWGSYGALWNDK
ncbi:MAG: hypothetical protein LC797_04235 [Chloroflexi bacterium]|nr:hypothetical protein [Chloroflexota bacterium]